MSNSEKMSTVRVSCDRILTQTVMLHSLLGISQGDTVSRNLQEGSLWELITSNELFALLRGAPPIRLIVYIV